MVVQISSLGKEVVSRFSCIEPEVVFESETKEIALGCQLRESLFFKHAEP